VQISSLLRNHLLHITSKIPTAKTDDSKLNVQMMSLIIHVEHDGTTVNSPNNPSLNKK
jgi:hypothetical protein